jgi:hypothetical protein
MPVDYRPMTDGHAIASAQFNEDSAKTDEKSAPSLYWRLEDGSIHLLPGGINGSDRAMRNAGQPLSSYGLFNRFSRGGLNPDKDELCFLVQAGGAKELPAAQVFGVRWHRRPSRHDTWSHRALWDQVDAHVARGLSEREAVEQVLPQLQGVEFPEEHPCSMCNGRIFLSRNDLSKHEGVMHREDVRQREMRDTFTDALKTQAAALNRGGDNSELLGMMVQALAQLASRGAEQEATVKELMKSIAPEAKITNKANRPPEIEFGDSQ